MKNITSQITIFILIFSTLISCNNTSDRFKKLNLISSIEQLSDSSYISDVRDINYSKEGFIYISDYKRGQVFKLDSQNLTLEATIGNYGDGPGEFKGPSKIFTLNENLYVQNDFKRSIDLFKNNIFIESIKLPQDIQRSHFVYNFFVNDESIYLAAPIGAESSIQVFKANEILKSGGEIFQFEHPTQIRIRNGRHLFEYKNRIISISDNLPMIEIYDSELNFLSTFNYSSLVQYITNSIEFIEAKKNKKPNSFTSIVKDVALFNDTLYLLSYDYNKDKKSCNKIIVLSIEDDNFKLRDIFILEQDSWYSSIEVNKNYLYAYNSTSSFLEQYNY